MTEQQTRQQLYDTMIFNPGTADRVPRKTAQLIVNKDRYAAIARHFVNPGLKWWLVAVIHEMECAQNFNCYLGNGQRWDRKTSIVPIGRGPFESFEEGAMDALHMQGADKITDWSTGNVLYFLEGYNGYGYTKYHNMNSPYLWAGCQHYAKGKYAYDGHFDPEMVSQQIGVALMLKNIIDK